MKPFLYAKPMEVLCAAGFYAIMCICIALLYRVEMDKYDSYLLGAINGLTMALLLVTIVMWKQRKIKTERDKVPPEE